MTSKIEAKVTHRFKASAERVYDAWLDPEKARLWQKHASAETRCGLPAALIDLGLSGEIKRVEIDARVGGSFLFSDMRDGTETKHRGTYLELDRPRKIVFTWIFGEQDEADPSKVTLTIEPDGQGCIVSVVHEMDAKWADYIDQTESGWSCMLKAIDAFLDGMN